MAFCMLGRNVMGMCRVSVLQLQRAGQAGLVEAVAAQEAKHDPHAQRLAQQMRLAKPFGVRDGVLDAAAGGAETTGVVLGDTTT